MRKYAFIKDGKVDSVIDGKDDNSRNWEEYYSKTMGMKCVAVPDELRVSTSDAYEDGQFKNAIEQWRSTAKLPSRKFWLGVEFYPYGDGFMLGAIQDAIKNLAHPKMKKKVMIELERTHEFNRNAKSTLMMINAIGMTAEQADDFFKWAEAEKWDEE